MSEPASERVAIFGGSFDPPHRGHLAVAVAAAREFALDELLFVPAALQPLKLGGATAGFADRFAMTQLLCDEAVQEAKQDGVGTRFSVSMLDAAQPDGSPNYTLATLRRLRAQVGTDAQIFVLVGADAFLDLRRWREPDALLAEAEWIVASRPGFALDELAPAALSAAQMARVHLLEGIAEPASATQIRESLLHHDGAAEFITPPVLHYIREHHLYGA